MSVCVSCNARGVPALSSANEGLTSVYSVLTASVPLEGKHSENNFCLLFVIPGITSLLHPDTVSLPSALVCILLPITIVNFFLNFISLFDHINSLAPLSYVTAMMASLSDTTVLLSTIEYGFS